MIQLFIMNTFFHSGFENILINLLIITFQRVLIWNWILLLLCSFCLCLCLPSYTHRHTHPHCLLFLFPSFLLSFLTFLFFSCCFSSFNIYLLSYFDLWMESLYFFHIFYIERYINVYIEKRICYIRRCY